MRDLERGTVVRWKGWWGVLEGKNYLDRWEAEPIRLKPDDVVEIQIRHKSRRKK